MTSIPKYSWAIKQVNSKKIYANVQKCKIKSDVIESVIFLLKKSGLPISDPLISEMLNAYLYERYRQNLFIAIWRSVKGIHPLVSKDIFEGYTFDKFKKQEAKIHIKQFYKIVSKKTHP